MGYVPYKKGTLLIPTGGTNHLFVIVTDKCQSNEHLLVNVTTIRPNIKHDPTCELKSGDHPFIKQDSYVEYRRAEIKAAAWLTKMVDGFVYRPNTDVTDTLLQLIRDGFEDSPFVSGRVLRYFKAAP